MHSGVVEMSKNKMLRITAAVLCIVYSFSVAEGAATGMCSRLDADVLILGGGMGGVSTASRLMTLGNASFMLFEAEENLGGRMRRQELVPGVFFAEGPAYIHGVDQRYPTDHPVYNLMTQCVNGGLSGRFITDDILSRHYRGTADVTTETNSRATIFDDAVNSVFNTMPNPDISVRQGFENTNWSPPSNNLDNLVEWFAFDFDYAEDPSVTSVLGSLNDETDSGFVRSGGEAVDYFIDDARGYVELINCLARDFVSNRSLTHLNSTVTKITNSNDCVCVEALENGTTNQYCGRYAVLTFSMGVLKSNPFRNVLTPFFSQARQDAMSSFNMGRYQNTFAVFDQRVWDTDVFFVTREVSRRGFFPVIANAFVNRGINAVIMPTTGDIATEVAAMDEQTLNQSVTEFFTSIYGPSAPPPIQLTRESYLTNPLFLGSYLHIGVGYTAEAHRSLLSPELSLYFAGETYHRNHYGNINGALLSGRETGETVWRALGNSGIKYIVNCHLLLWVAGFLFVLEFI